MNMRKLVAAALIGTTVLTATGCYGKFALTKKVYDFNGKVHPNGIVKSVVMVALTIIPVYGIAIFADAIILNTVEFWTGANPVATGNTYQETDAQGNQVTAIKMPDGSLDMTVRNSMGAETKLTLVREDDMVKALDAQGKVVAQGQVESSEVTQ